MNHEALHGDERRRVHEDMRRRMLQRAMERQQEPVPPQDGGTGPLPRLTQHHDDTGRTAIAIQEAAVLEQSINPRSTLSIENYMLARIQTTTNYILLSIPIAFNKGRYITWEMLRCVSRASDTMAPLPHTQPSSHTTDDTLHNDNNNDNDDEDNPINDAPNQHHNQPPLQLTNANVNFYASVIRWVLRLNLALFYTNGRYPTLLHRITNMRPYRATNPGNPRDDTPRPAYTIVGKMLLLQAVAELVRTAAHLSVRAWGAGRRGRLQRLAEGGTTRLGAGGDNGGVALREWIEVRVPSSKRCCSNADADDGGGGGVSGVMVVHDADDERSTRCRPMIQCSICMNDRKHPAALTNCGHVFCWGCVQHWISTVKTECPICRAVARPQDVISLYQYDGF